jgi:hypothetical protein
MYRVSTGDARTDLYGIGQGLAQVADLNPIREQVALDKQLKASEEAAKKKQQDARENEIMKNLAISSKVAIRPNDQKYFAEKQANITSFVEQNIDKLRTGEANSLMEYQRMLGELQTEAEMSKNAREFAEAEFQKFNQSPSKYRYGSEKKIGEFLAAPEYAGNWDTSSVPLKENIDYTDRTNKVLGQIVDDIMIKTPTKSSFTEEEAYELIKKDISSDPRYIDQANFELDQDTKLGLTKDTDAIEHMANKYKGKLVRNITKQPRVTGGSGNKSSANLVSTVSVTNTKDPKNNWQADIRYEGKNLPYQRVVRTTADGTFAQDVIVDKVIKRGAKTYVKVSAKPGADGTAEVFEIDYDTQDGKELLAGLGIKNPMALYDESQPDVTPTKIDNVETQKYSQKKGDKTETNTAKPTLKVGDIVDGYKYNGGDSKKSSSWTLVK